MVVVTVLEVETPFTKPPLVVFIVADSLTGAGVGLTDGATEGRGE